LPGFAGGHSLSAWENQTIKVRNGKSQTVKNAKNRMGKSGKSRQVRSAKELTLRRRRAVLQTNSHRLLAGG
jgi:hypothetical protein